MGYPTELIVKFASSRPDIDRRDFCACLEKVLHVGIYLDSDSKEACRFFLGPLPRMSYDGREFIDVVALETQKWLNQKDDHPDILGLCDQDGQALGAVAKARAEPRVS